MSVGTTLQPLPGFQALDGCNCLAASFHRICAYNTYPISEEMLLCLGAGVGFAYLHSKGTLPFIGGRGNVRAFHTALSAPTGIHIHEHTTSSSAKAERELLAALDTGQPVCVYVDMAYLPYLGLGEEAHFGEHAIVVAAADSSSRQAIVADHDPYMSGVKKGGFYPITLDQLAQARSSTFKPFPPRNRWFSFNFHSAHPVSPEAIMASIRQTTQAMLHPPIRNMGVAGFQTAAQRILKLPEQSDEKTLRASLFNFYTYIEVGGSGGGLFRYMVSRFLAEAAQLTGVIALVQASRDMHACAEAWRSAALPLREAFRHESPHTLALEFARSFQKIGKMETLVWNDLAETGANYG